MGAVPFCSPIVIAYKIHKYSSLNHKLSIVKSFQVSSLVSTCFSPALLLLLCNIYPCFPCIFMQYISLFPLYCYAIHIPVSPVLLCNIYPRFPCIVMQYISLFPLYCYAIYIPVSPVLLCNIYPCSPWVCSVYPVEILHKFCF